MQIQTSSYKRICYICTCCFFLFTLYWIYSFHKYQLIAFQEDTQLFRTDQSYLFHYLNIPGGLSLYLGNFVTQYYQNLWVGTLILTAVIGLIFMVILRYSSRSGSVYPVFVYPFIAYLLLLFAVVEPTLRLGEILGLLFALLSFWYYTTLSGKYKRLLGLLIALVLYFLTGGHFVLYLLLVCVHTFLTPGNRKIPFILLLVLCLFAVPYLSYLFLYTTSLKTTFLSLTPFTSSVDNTAYKIVWLYLPLCYLICSLLIQKKNFSRGIVFRNTAYILLLLAITTWGIHKKANPETEHIAAMAYHVEKGNWENVLEYARKEGNKNNALKYYYTNLALSEQGVLANELFKYPQIGPAGLFVKRTLSPSFMYAQGELYYRLGNICAAEQNTYEALVSNPYEYGAKTLKRLTLIHLLLQNKPEFDKYVRLLKKSPTYRHWAIEQELWFDKKSKDPKLIIPGLPAYKKQPERFMDYARHEPNLTASLKLHPRDKKTFEYLMASLLLQKELPAFLLAMKRYAQDMGYTVYPRYIQEALTLCYHNFDGQDDLLEKYPVDKEIDNRYRSYAAAFQEASKSAAHTEQLKNNFGDTYWYYYQYNKPVALEETKVKEIY